HTNKHTHDKIAPTHTHTHTQTHTKTHTHTHTITHTHSHTHTNTHTHTHTQHTCAVLIHLSNQSVAADCVCVFTFILEAFFPPRMALSSKLNSFSRMTALLSLSPTYVTTYMS